MRLFIIIDLEDTYYPTHQVREHIQAIVESFINNGASCVATTTDVRDVRTKDAPYKELSSPSQWTCVALATT